MGNTYFISRHPGAVAWAARRGIPVDRTLDHLEIDLVHPGDTVIGTLPINLVARVCERGGRYLHLSLSLPPELRGQELSAETLERLGARLEEYEAVRKPCPEARK
ncbi:CRISPR-associated protein Csx16 [Ectothiorhodospira shaposhnikovii]|uniref:CRISPR-associated protein Csx16 n=1 Tax=Ectothiorhodospira shaposhnikovii TaxID=1054 RepID=UPI001905EB9B|nr:CRISPR-associated protein Csx16 [Ectothiorhodospira shaposhnikovii]MBK1673193.1 CRISPR-associated protein Csx16 [Ectothiorhodospira shaposhnikovii]